jgi:hypothetical protein
MDLLEGGCLELLPKMAKTFAWVSLGIYHVVIDDLFACVIKYFSFYILNLCSRKSISKLIDFIPLTAFTSSES